MIKWFAACNEILNLDLKSNEIYNLKFIAMYVHYMICGKVYRRSGKQKKICFKI